MQYYQGRIVGQSKEKIGYHMIKYDDGDLMTHNLSKEIVQLEEDDGTTIEDDDDDDDDEEEDEMELDEEEEEEEEDELEDELNDGMTWSKGDLVQCLAPNSRWYRATVEAAHPKTNQYDILYERSNTKEKDVNSDRVMEYIKFKDRSKKGTYKIVKSDAVSNVVCNYR